MSSKPENIDQYIAAFPADIQDILQKVRQTIASVAAQATESINYGIPTFIWHGNLVHFAGMKHHIGFYPTPSGIDKFKDKLQGYETSKGAVKFPLERDIPFDLIAEITSFRVRENEEKSQLKKQKKKCVNGHTFFKSSDCPTCPQCEAESKPQTGFLSHLPAPARRALQHAGIDSLAKLSEWTEKDILQLHGMGPSSIPVLKKSLQENQLSFSPEK